MQLPLLSRAITEDNFIMVGHIFSPAACPPSQISQSEVKLRNGHVTCESCLFLGEKIPHNLTQLSAFPIFYLYRCI